MNHKTLIKIVLDYDGYIIGSYVREWLVHGSPQDDGWNDIDIKCPIESVGKIRSEIRLRYPKIKIDVFPNTKLFDVGYPQAYSCNLIKYDGEFKPCLDLKYNIIDLTKNKICAHLSEVGKRRNLAFEKKLIFSGWELIISGVTYNLNNYKFD